MHWRHCDISSSKWRQSSPACVYRSFPLPVPRPCTRISWSSPPSSPPTPPVFLLLLPSGKQRMPSFIRSEFTLIFFDMEWKNLLQLPVSPSFYLSSLSPTSSALNWLQHTQIWHFHLPRTGLQEESEQTHLRWGRLVLRGNWELFAVEEKGRPHTLIHTEHTNTTIRI